VAATHTPMESILASHASASTTACLDSTNSFTQACNLNAISFEAAYSLHQCLLIAGNSLQHRHHPPTPPNTTGLCLQLALNQHAFFR
jgi:hypothetical protein